MMVPGLRSGESGMWRSRRRTKTTDKEWSDKALTDAAPKKKRSRWDQTPAKGEEETKIKPRWDQTPTNGTLITGQTPEGKATSLAMVDDPRYKAITDDELNILLPGTGEVFSIVPSPADYVPAPAVRKMVPAQPTEVGFMVKPKAMRRKPYKPPVGS